MSPTPANLYKKIHNFPITTDDVPALARVRTLSYLDILQIFDSSFYTDPQTNTTKKLQSNFIVETLDRAVIGTLFTYDDSGAEVSIKGSDLMKYVEYSIIEDLVVFIMQASRVTNEMVQSVELGMKIQLEDAFKEDEWDCTKCQARELDQQRNCPMLDKKFHSSSLKYYTSAGVYSECPIGLIDKKLLRDALEAYSMYNAGFLPEPGSYYEQTEFFVVIGSVVRNIIKKHESDELEKIRNKH